MMAWRSHPDVYKGFYIQKNPLTWCEHISWWETRRDREDWIVSVVGRIDKKNRDIGVVNVSSLNTATPEIGVYIGEITAWGCGFGYSAIRQIMKRLRSQGFTRARASILADNIASRKAFENAGFRESGPGRKGELVYEAAL
jgi:RimJ/RimL family protein N-acetyltransferase